MNRVMTYCTPGPKAAALALRVLKPPVARVVKLWQRASNRSRSSSIRATVSTPVSSTYTAQRRLAVSLMRGCSLSAVGPGDSAMNSCMPPMPRMGRMAMVSTMMPMPPTHWV